MTKQTKCSEHPAKTQIRLGGSAQYPVGSGSSRCAEWIAKDPRYIHADGEDSDQTGQMLRLICLHWAHMSFYWFCHAATHIIWKPKEQTVGGVLST